MNKKEQTHFKKLLLKKRKELTDHLAFIKANEMESTTKELAGDHSSYAFHMADQGTDTAEREKNFFYAQRDGRLLYHIDQALERIEDGSFGQCDSCGQTIGKDRLEWVPHARMCIACKSKEETKPKSGDDTGEAV